MTPPNEPLSFEQWFKDENQYGDYNKDHCFHGWRARDVQAREELALKDNEISSLKSEILAKDNEIKELKEKLKYVDDTLRNIMNDPMGPIEREALRKLPSLEMKSYDLEVEVWKLKASLATALERAQKAEEKVRELSEVLNFIKLRGRPHGRPVWEVEIDPMIEKALSASDPVSRVDDIQDPAPIQPRRICKSCGRSHNPLHACRTAPLDDVKDSEKDLLKARIAGLTGSLKISESRAEDLRAKLKAATDMANYTFDERMEYWSLAHKLQAKLRVARDLIVLLKDTGDAWTLRKCQEALAAIDKDTEHEKADKD